MNTKLTWLLSLVYPSRPGSLERLKDYAQKEIPWYSAYGFGVITREDVRLYGHSMRNPKVKAIECHTSGSTGTPLVTYSNQDLMEQITVRRAWGYAGYYPFDRVAMIRSFVPEEGKPYWMEDTFRNFLYFSAYHLSPESLESYICKLQSWKPRIIRGYPSALYIFARLAKRKLDLDLRSVICSSEVLTDDYRDTIEDYFGCKVFNWYGQAERTVVAYDTDCGFHVDKNYGHLEITDGRMIATNLHNYAQPLINYDTGDLASWKDCACGEKAISAIHGRQDDILKIGDRWFPSINFYTQFYHYDLAGFQIIQRGDEIEVRVLACKEKPERIISDLKKRLGECKIRVTERPFMQTDDGKKRGVIRLD